MRRTFFIMLVAILAIALVSIAVARTGKLVAIHPDKLQEFNDAGLDPETFQAQRTGPVFANLDHPVYGPDADMLPDAGSDSGIMQYDNGVLTALYTALFWNGGNIFKQGDVGGSLSTITLNSFSFYFMESSPSDTAMWIQVGSILNSTSFWARESENITGLSNSGPSFTSPVLNLIPQSSLLTSGVFTNSFVLGFWNINTNSTLPVNNETIPASDNCNGDAPDCRGWTGDDGSSTTITYTTIPINFMLRARVSTANALPVELMAFEVE